MSSDRSTPEEILKRIQAEEKQKEMRKEENYIFFSGMQQVWERPAPCWILLRN